MILIFRVFFLFCIFPSFSLKDFSCIVKCKTLVHPQTTFNKLDTCRVINERKYLFGKKVKKIKAKWEVNLK